jgi:hypothetical protein
MKSLALILFTSIIAASATAAAQDRGDPTPLLRHEADLEIASSGLYRIPLPSEVLRDASPGLTDVRIIDDDTGREVPWLVAGQVAPRPAIESVALTPLEATQERRRRIYDRFGRSETYLLQLPPAPVGADGFDLVLDTEVPEFTRHFRVVETNPNRDGALRDVASGTLFRFSGPLREKRRIPLSASGGTFVVTLEGDDSAWLSPHFTAVAARPPHDEPNITVPLSIVSERSVDGVTVLDVARPRGVIPSSLSLASSTSTFHRRVEILDVGFGSARPGLGAGTVHRIDDPIGDEHLELFISRARGDTLEIRIEDGDAPPLSDLAIVAIVRAPVLVADLPARAMLRFGGGRLRAPEYDLSRLEQSDLGRRLVEADLPVARVSAPRPNPAFDSAPALAWAMRPGVEAERYRFRYARAVFLDPSEEGLSRIRLSAADLGVLLPSGADLRIVDVEGRQWPYLAEADAAVDPVAMLPEVTEVSGGSVHRATLPSGPVPIRALSVRTSAAFVDRDYVLHASVEDGEEQVVARGRLRRRPDADEEMRIEVGDARADRLRLVVRDGADAPLTSVELIAEISVPDIYVAAPAGDYAILLGANDVAPPRYEIQRARSLILSVTPNEAFPRALGPNRMFVPPRKPLHLEDWALWGVLLLSVLLLSLLTLRSLRTEMPPSPEEGASEAGPAETEEPA